MFLLRQVKGLLNPTDAEGSKEASFPPSGFFFVDPVRPPMSGVWGVDFIFILSIWSLLFSLFLLYYLHS